MEYGNTTAYVSVTESMGQEYRLRTVVIWVWITNGWLAYRDGMVSGVS